MHFLVVEERVEFGVVMFVSRVSREKEQERRDKEAIDRANGVVVTHQKEGSCLRTLLLMLITFASTVLLLFNYLSEPQFHTTSYNTLRTRRNTSRRKSLGESRKPLHQLPWIFAVTPTYKRVTQKADLVRLSQTLQHVDNLKWIIVEDAYTKSDRLARFLDDSGLDFIHLYKKSARKPKHKAVRQRNLALSWIRKNVDPHHTPGVVYFMDDDNTYDRKLFEIMRGTRRVSCWRVGFAGGVLAEGPVVRNHVIVNFHTNFAPKRPMPLDMAGFAVSLRHIIRNRYVEFRSTPKAGHMESDFLMRLTTRKSCEPLADNNVYVWHTQTKRPLIMKKNPTERWIEV